MTTGPEVDNVRYLIILLGFLDLGLLARWAFKVPGRRGQTVPLAIYLIGVTGFFVVRLFFYPPATVALLNAWSLFTYLYAVLVTGAILLYEVNK